MNKTLTYEIVKHIFAELAIIKADYINLNNTKPLSSKEFLLKEILSFENDENVQINNNVWGCQLYVASKDIKIILGDCSQDSEVLEYCLLTQVKDCPIYCIYFVIGDPQQTLIACSLDGSQWMECNTHLQATFLAGMELIKDYNVNWSYCSDYSKHFKYMQSFINYYNMMHGVKYEG